MKKTINTFLVTCIHDFKIEPSHILLPKTRAYVKCYDGQIKVMHCLIEDDELLEKLNTIWGKVSVDIKKRI